MGDSIEHWRATIGQWSGGRPRQCVTSQHHIAQTSNQIGYRHIRFLVLVSLLVIGCVELNPGPDHENSAPTRSAGASLKFHRRTGTYGQHGEQYEIKMAAFLFARALNETEEFRLASNIDGAGNFDDLVFRYRLRNSDVWKTCFIQLKHKRTGGRIQPSSLTQESGDFSLFEYFKSFCKIKNNAALERNMEQWGPVGDFEFVIYTNREMVSKSLLQGEDTDPVSILSSGKDEGKYITFVEPRGTDNFDKTSDKDIFYFFEGLSIYYELIKDLDNLLKGETSGDKNIIPEIEECQKLIRNKAILEKLNSLKSNLNKSYVTTIFKEVTFFKEFLSKIKIFQSQSNEKSLNGLIEKELQKACKASSTVANFIYTKFSEGLNTWWERDRNVEWLNENSELWQAVQKQIISEIKEISEPENKEIVRCGISFNQQLVQKLSDAIKQNTVLNIVTNSKFRILQKLKTYQALNSLGYLNSLFIGSKSLMNKQKEIKKLWPCKWINVLVVDCDSVGNVAHTLLDILQQSADCGQKFDISDENTLKTLDDALQDYQIKVILISTRQKASGFQEELRNNSYFEDNCVISDLDEESQKKILERPINFQGTNVALSTLVGKDPPKSIKTLLNSDVISIVLSNEHELSVGRDLDENCKHFVPRVLQNQIYLKEDILKRTDYAIVFAVSGLQADDLKNFLPAGEKIFEFVDDKIEGSHTFKIVSDLPKTGFSAELENMKAYNKAGQNIKPEDVRYIILGNKNPDSEFRELKTLCRNVHWIHMDKGFFLWRDTNCNIDIIRKYIDSKNCEKFNMKDVMEHNDRTMLLIAEPGMGKSTFLSYMAYEIKKRKPSVWVLRINLNEHTNELEKIKFEQKFGDKCKIFLWNAAHSPEQEAWKVTKEIFLQALEQTGKMFIILDGFDEISPDYSFKVEMLIRTIRDETNSKLWISSRFSCRQKLEDILGKFAFTLQPFTLEDQIQFLKQYWSEDTEICNQGDLQTFAKKLLSLCSQNFSDKDGEFTGIPLQTMMLGEAFANEVKEYCSSGEFNLPEKFNLLSLFKKFTENKFHIYFGEKNKMDGSKLGTKRSKEHCEEKHMISALISLFSPNELKQIPGAINTSVLEEAKKFLQKDTAHHFGLITDTLDGKPQFIHRCFAEYFAAKWFTGHFGECEGFISNILYNTTNEVIRNIFEQMLAEDSEIHGSVLNNDIHALEEIWKKKTDINTSDKGGRTVLHLAASYNRPYIKQLLTFPGIEANKPDAVLKWTPLRYADRTKSWMAMDILLQNGANPDDIVLTRHKSKVQEWGQAAYWECASKGHIKLLEFLLDCGIQANERVEVPGNLHEKRTLLHRASYCGQLEVVKLIVNRGADINIRDANNNTTLHLAAESGNADIIKLLLDNGMSLNLTNTEESTPLHFSASFNHLEATKILVERGAVINNTNKYGNTPLMEAVLKNNLESFRYLIEAGADIKILNANKNNALHLAAQLGSVDIMKLLLDKGISVNLTNTEKSTPLHFCAQFGHLEATKVLVERGAAVNNTNEYGNTPLMEAALKGNLESFRYLIGIVADINISNAKNKTALHLAAQSGSVAIIQLLLDKGIPVNLTNESEFTPLHFAAQFGHLEATKFLVERGAAINKTNRVGNTPLMEAALKGNLETFRYLIRRDADVKIHNAKKNNALHLAAQSGIVDIMNLLLDTGMSVNVTNTHESTPLHVSAEFGQLQATEFLVGKGAAINYRNSDGNTPLMLAAYCGEFEILRYLTEMSADINICDKGNDTILHLASERGSVDIIKLLLDKGISVNLTDTEGSTPLQVCVEFGHLEAAKILVERGAAINKTNKYGFTPLMLAAYCGELEIFRYLKDINIRAVRNGNNSTVLHLVISIRDV